MSETPGKVFASLGGLGNGAWRGALRISQRPALFRREGFGELGRGLPSEACVGAFCVTVLSPGRECGAGMVQGREQRLVRELVRPPSIDREDGPAPEKGPYTCPSLQKEHSH